MREVEPGTIVTVDERGIRERTYWRLESRLHTDDQDTTVARVRELLDDIVRRQLVSDVPECVLLSGGLDSSAITALSARELSIPVRSFSVDFAGQADNFTPDELRPTMDTPYVHDVAKHVGSDHTDIVLDHNELADPDVRRRVITARDLPLSMGDLDVSLYLLFKAIRAQSTVALSGESADEIFGGYRQFHDPTVQRTDDFPWIAIREESLFDSTTQMYTQPVRSAVDVETYKRDRYAEAVGEVARVDGEDDFTHRMRVMSYLHLTRFVRILLDRKDRMSMAVGLEVRVPFCDHRLVEYVYNTPWSTEDLRRAREELAAWRRPRRAARVRGATGQEPLSIHLRSAVRSRNPAAGQGSAQFGQRRIVRPDRPGRAGAADRTRFADTAGRRAEQDGAGPRLGDVDRHLPAGDHCLTVVQPGPRRRFADIARSPKVVDEVWRLLTVSIDDTDGAVGCCRHAGSLSRGAAVSRCPPGRAVTRGGLPTARRPELTSAPTTTRSDRSSGLAFRWHPT